MEEPRFLCAAVALLAVSCSAGGKSAASSAAATPSASPSRVPGAPPEIDRTTPLPSPLPQVTARVNGQPVPLRNVAMLAKKAMAQNQGDEAKEPFAYRDAMNQFIVRELLFQEALARKLEADSKKIEAAYNQIRVNHKDDKEWGSYLAQQGMDDRAFRAELRIMQTVGALVRQESEKVTEVSEVEIQAFFEGNPSFFDTGERLKASHILFMVPQGVAAERKGEIRTKAEGLLARLRSGEDFAKLARRESEDPGSASQGGELPPFARGQMVGPFEEAAFSLKPGQVSDVVETPYGFHILKLHERLPAQKIPLEAVKEQLREQLLQKKRQEALQALVNSLRAKAKIETYL